MAEDLGFRIVFEPDTSKLEEKVSSIQSKPIEVPVTAEASGISKEIEREIGKAKAKVKFDIDDSAIDDYRSKLKDLGLGDIAINEAVKGLRDMGVQVTKVHSSMEEVNADGQRLKAILLEGKNLTGDMVKVVQRYNESEERALTTNVSITHEYEKQAKAQQSLADKTAKWKTAQENALKDLQSKAKNQSKPLDDTYLGDFNSAIAEIQSKLNGVGDSVTTEVQNTISKLMADAARALKEAQNKQYVATSLRTKDIDTVKAMQRNALTGFESKVTSAGFTMESLEVGDLKVELDKVFDANSLTAYLNKLDVAKSKFEALKATAKATADVTAKQNAEAKAQAKTQAQQGVFKNKKDTATTNLNARIQELQKAGLYVDKIKAEFEGLESSLKNVTNADELKVWTSALESAEAKVKQFQASTAQLAKQQASDIGSNQINQIEQLQQQMNGLGDTDGFNALRAELEKLKAQYQDVVTALNSTDITDEEFQKLQQTVASLDTQLQKTSSTLSKFGSDDKSQQYITKMEANVEKLKANFAAMKENWSAAMNMPELKAKIDNFEQVLQGVDAANVMQVQAAFQKLKSEIKAAGADCQSFGKNLEELKQFGMQLFSWQKIFQYAKDFFKDVISNVKELNSAMTELKKVTDLTSEGYDKFLTQAGSRAKEIGTSVSSYIEGTANFARLGYSVEDAVDLSEAANILYKVGDGFSSIDDSTDAIISAMKAYGIATSDVTTIIDKLNEVSNKTSITTADLASAMQKSASALAVGGLDFDKSLALIVAGNETTRDSAATGRILPDTTAM